MTWTVVWEPTALDTATRHLAKDPASVDSLLHATDQLVDNPRPEWSRPWGTEYRRLRHGPWRVLYRMDSSTQTVYIEHIGWIPA